MRRQVIQVTWRQERPNDREAMLIGRRDRSPGSSWRLDYLDYL